MATYEDKHPERIDSYLRKRKRDLSWPHYDFNEAGQALVMPFEKFCRHQHCEYRKRFRRYAQLHKHLTEEHGLEIAGPVRFRLGWEARKEDVMEWMERVLIKGEKNVPPVDPQIGDDAWLD